MSDRIAQGARGAASRLSVVNKKAEAIANASAESPSLETLAVRLAGVFGKISVQATSALDKIKLTKEQSTKAQSAGDEATSILQAAGITQEQALGIFAAANSAGGEIDGANNLLTSSQDSMANIKSLAETTQEAYVQIAALLRDDQKGVGSATARIQQLATEGAAGGIHYADNLQRGDR